MSNLSNQLKRLRKQKNISQANVAQHLGLTEGAYRHYEAGRAMPPAETLQILASYFNVSVDYLLGAEASDIPNTSAIAKSERSFFQTSRPLTPEEYEKAQSYINFLIEQDQQEN